MILCLDGLLVQVDFISEAYQYLTLRPGEGRRGRGDERGEGREGRRERRDEGKETKRGQTFIYIYIYTMTQVILHSNMILGVQCTIQYQTKLTSTAVNGLALPIHKFNFKVSFT